MKKRKNCLALLLASALAVSAGACGSPASDSGTTTQGEDKSSAESNTDESDDVDAFEAAKENMKEITSLEGQMVMDMEMEISAGEETQSMQSVTTMDMACFYDPMRIKMDMTVDAGETGTTEMSIYAEENEDDTYTMYVNNGTSWQSQSVELGDLEQYDAGSSMSAYLDDSYQFEEAGTEQVDGADAYKYTGTITGDNMKETLESSGALNSLSSLGTDASQLESMLDGLGDIPITLWIDKETLYPAKYEMDMGEVMDALTSKIVESMGEQMEGFSMKITKMTARMTCSNYNEASDFSIPDEAKAE